MSELQERRLILSQELHRRIQKNPRYSLRAFSKALGVSHSLLSLILSGKRPISQNLVSKLQKQGILGDESKAYFNAQEFQKISLDTFELLSQWYCYAILSLLELTNTKLSSRWISQQLNIKETEAKRAIFLLKRLKLITKKKGSWKQSGAPLKVENSTSTVATRHYHKQLLKKAEESLENDPFEIRDLSSTTFAMDSKKIAYAREQIRSFRRRLVKDLENMGNPDAVFHLAVQIYPVSKVPSNNKE